MRFIDSMTLVTSTGFGSNVLSWPVLTRPLLSLELEILTGAALGMIQLGGAMELPPEIELTEPMRSSKPPRAPKLYTPYMGLCGFTLVSFCDNAGITVPVVFAITLALVARALMPRRCALSAWKRNPKLLSMKFPLALGFGTMVPGSPSLL